MKTRTVSSTDFGGLKLFKRGKVRDVYEAGDDLLIVATDRISCFDVVLPDPIPGKGCILTGLSAFWFELLRGVIENHLLSTDVRRFPAETGRYHDTLMNRSMLVRRTKPVPVECVVRGYLSGSGWKEYSAGQTVCGIKLPPGLLESQRLEEPIFTPATKAEEGHDINVSEDEARGLCGDEAFSRMKEASISIYCKARDYMEGRGIIIADTKFEFGVYDGRVILIDEVLTPDSSRFWPKEKYKPGGPQESFDKQYVRDYLETLDWDKTPPAPSLPGEVIEKTRDKYIEAFRKITGSLPPV